MKKTVGSSSKLDSQHSRPHPQAGSSSQAANGSQSIPSEDPPGYSGPSSSSAPRDRPNVLVPGLPQIAYPRYRVPNSTMSKDRTTRTVQDSELISNAVALEKFVYDQAALPPHPQVRITGEHTEHGSRRLDFDLTLSLLRYITRPSGDHWNYVRAVDNGVPAWRGGRSKSTEPSIEGGVREWVQRFSNDSGMGKTFQISREVVNLDKAFLDGHIRSLMASIKYHGRVNIGFPVSHAKVVVQPSAKGNNLISAIMSPFVETKRYETVVAVWPFASLEPALRHDSGQPTEWAVQSESAWLNSWKPLIVESALAGRQGWITLEDCIEYAMGSTDELRTLKPWGMDRS